mmetsp:Transcript_1726/g.4594  ORF Transcript_1726/g.4594 Transcript_1726/m.4594 type:complete len:266 (+) Transcript_1726:241-1038(+)
MVLGKVHIVVRCKISRETNHILVSSEVTAQVHEQKTAFVAQLVVQVKRRLETRKQRRCPRTTRLKRVDVAASSLVVDQRIPRVFSHPRLAPFVHRRTSRPCGERDVCIARRFATIARTPESLLLEQVLCAHGFARVNFRVRNAENAASRNAVGIDAVHAKRTSAEPHNTRRPATVVEKARRRVQRMRHLLAAHIRHPVQIVVNLGDEARKLGNVVHTRCWRHELVHCSGHAQEACPLRLVAGPARAFIERRNGGEGFRWLSRTLV